MQLRPFPQPLLEYFELFRNESSQRHSQFLMKTLLQTCSIFSQCFVLIDGFDEVPAKFRKDYLQMLQSLHTSSVKIFITGRSYLKEELSSFSKVSFENVEAREGDIRSFVRDTIAKSEYSNDTLDETLTEDVVKSLSENADGMFLLAALHLRTILDQVKKSEVKKILRSLSTNLQTIFEGFLQRIKASGSRQKVAFTVLTWLAYTKRPLSVDELLHALATDAEDTKLEKDNFVSLKILTESCLGLVVIDERSSMVRFVHFSLQEYVQANRLELFPHGESLIATTCLTYMHFAFADLPVRDENFDRLFEFYPFLEYSCCFWGYHAGKSIDSNVKKLTADFVFNPTRVKFTLELMQSNIPRYLDSQALQYPQAGNALHCIAVFGLVEFIPDLVRSGLPIDAQDYQQRTPLHIAIHFGQQETAKTLLEAGASVTLRALRLYTPLFLACELGNNDIVQLLLQHGANPNALCTDRWTALQKAADSGHLYIMKQLLEHGGVPGLSSKMGLTALHRACGRGHIEIIELLLSLDSVIDVKTRDNWTPLHGAASSGRTAVVRLLVEKGADLNHVADDGCTALHRACSNGHIETVKALLHFRAHRYLPDFLEELPLHKAARRGSEQIIELLLDTTPGIKDIQLSAVNYLGHVPRETALSGGHYTLASQLARLGGDESYSATDIETAIRFNDSNHFVELFADGSHNGISDQNGLSLFHQAVSRGNLDIASYLARRDSVDIERPAHNGWTPLHTAAKRGKLDMVELCLRHGAQVSRQDEEGRTPLFQACSGGNTDIVRLLIESGASPKAQDHRGFSCLYACAEAGHEDVVRLLVFSYGIEVTEEQSAAAEAGHYDVVEFFRTQRYSNLVRSAAAYSSSSSSSSICDQSSHEDSEGGI